MKRWLWYGVIVLAVALLGGERSSGEDIGKLQPVQTVWLHCENGRLAVRTDTGETGSGDTVSQAFADLNAGAAGEIFLDTADYLLITEECETLLVPLMEYLRPSCSVCLTDGEPQLELTGSYLEIHPPEITLMKYSAGQRQLPTLVTREGRMRLVP